MSKRKGYSAYRRDGKGPWLVTWRDGSGVKQTIRGISSEGIANRIGRAKAMEADLVRTGVISPQAAKASGASTEDITIHTKAWKAFLTGKGNGAGHISHSFSRLTKILELAKADTLGAIESSRVQDALVTIAAESSPQTARHYLTALKGFIHWCLKSNLLAADPIMAVARPNAAGETFIRRPLLNEDVAGIIEAANNGPVYGGVSGEGWAWYYRIMAYTGLRVSEAASLTPESFKLPMVGTSIVTLEAAYSKHKKRDELMIRDDLANALRPWMETKAAGALLFPFKKHAPMQKIFKKHCKAAGIEAGEGEILGMHSFRRFFITWAVRSGGLADAQRAARHSTPALTQKYADLGISDRTKTLSGLPPVKVEPKQERKAQ